jgi:prepilin-type N-terminal cleavage/methylation domain-containing protein
MNHRANIVTNRRSGFTLIELLLAMTFISVLLLTIALTIVQIANIYNRGIILKEVNQTSRSMSDELDDAMRGSSTFSIDPLARRYVTNEWGGRMCLGQYSYIWNYGTALDNVDSNRNQYSGPNVSGNSVIDSNGTTRYEISLVKAPDAGGVYCIPNVSGAYPKVDPTGAVELLRRGDHSLMIHSFAVVSNATSKDALSSQQLYKITFTLGTDGLDALNADQSACKPPGEAGSDLNYCAVQQFTLVIRVVSGVN